MPPPPLPPLPDAELSILRVLWEHGPAIVRRVQEQLPESGRNWAYTTVQTLLGRLVEKGYARVDRRGHAHRYRARVSREDLASRELEDLAERIFDGRTSPLILRLIEGTEFTDEEIARFQALLAAAEARREGSDPR